MKKWFKRLGFVVGVLAVALVLLVLAGSVVARQIGKSRAERDFPPPGRLVVVDGRVSHLYCTGSGSPTVILESGLDDLGSLSWSLVQEELGRTSRVCSYDRAGIMWSEPGEKPRDAIRIADELHALLTVASESPPYVLVGHSMGGVLVRVFDDRYPGEAEGFVLVDSAHPEQETRFPTEVQQLIADNDSELIPRWVFRVLAPYRTFIDGGHSARTAYWWRSFPNGVLGETEALPATFEEGKAAGALGSRPLVVLTSGEAVTMPAISDEGNAALRETLRELQDELAGLSTNSLHEVVARAGHYIQQDRPEAVVAAIRQVATAVGQGQPIVGADGTAADARHAAAANNNGSS